MRDRFPLLLVGGLLLLGFLGLTLMRGASRGEFADRLSTYRSEERGTRALYLLAEESGLPVSRRRADFQVIEQDTALVLLGVGISDRAVDDDGEAMPELPKRRDLFPAFSADGGTEAEEDEDEPVELANRLRAMEVSPSEREKLLEHVKAGHTVIYAPWKRETNPLLEATGITLEAVGRTIKIRTVVPAQPSPYTLGVERVETEVRSFLDLSESAAVPLLLDERTDAVVAALADYGRGHIVVLGAPELAMNRALGRADNAQLWLSLLKASAGKDRLLFDEFHHGFGGDRSIAEFAARYGLHLAIGQLVLGLCLWSLSLRRFGRPRTLALEERTAGAELLSAASRLYRAGKHRAFAAGLIASGLSQELATPAGLPSRASPEDVGARLRERGRPDLAAALAEVVQLSREVRSDMDVEQVARTAARARGLIKRRNKTTMTARRAT